VGKKHKKKMKKQKNGESVKGVGKVPTPFRVLYKKNRQR
jgi:hypothetical protein